MEHDPTPVQLLSPSLALRPRAGERERLAPARALLVQQLVHPPLASPQQRILAAQLRVLAAQATDLLVRRRQLRSQRRVLSSSSSRMRCSA